MTKVKGKVLWLTHQQTSKQKVLNINKVKLVDPNIVWDDVRPRPKRNPRHSARTATRLKMPYPPDRSRSPSPGEASTSRLQPASKRRRGLSQSSTDSTETLHYVRPAPRSRPQSRATVPSSPQAPTAARIPATARPAAQRQTDAKRLQRTATRRPHAPDQPVTVKRHHPDTPPQNQPPQPSRAQPTTRTAPTRRDDQKRLHRSAPRRPHAPDPTASTKRRRHFLPRSAKRPMDLQAPTPEQQERARISGINAAAAFLRPTSAGTDSRSATPGMDCLMETAND